MSRIGHRAEMARLPEHDGIKQSLRSAERLRAIGVTPKIRNQCIVDSWAIPADYGVEPVSGGLKSRSQPSVRQPGRTPLIGLCVPAAEPIEVGDISI